VRVKYWENHRSQSQQAGWSLGWISAVDVEAASDLDCGRVKRFVVRAYEKLTAFLELQRAIHEFAASLVP